MIVAKVLDATSTGFCPSINMLGENAGDKPKYLQWQRLQNVSGVRPGDTVVFVDKKMAEATDPRYDNVRKIGLLIEPFSLHQDNYTFAWDYRHMFHAIFSHYRPFVDSGRPFYFYPLGGSHVRLWGYFPKTKLVSILMDTDYATLGDQLRHEIAQRHMMQVDVLGEPYTDRLSSKVPALRPYRYSIIVERCDKEYYFSDKLVDCISQGTVPIYWGMASIGDVFNADGIIQFFGPDEIPAILDRISPQDYLSRQIAVRQNVSIAHRYLCAEDWIAKRYHHLLG